MKKLLVLLAFAGMLASCGNLLGKRVKGNGNIKSQEHSVSAFKNIDVSGAVDLYLSQGATQPVKIETDENLLQYIEVRQEGDRVIIRYRDDVNLHPTGKVKAYITTAVYNNIEVSGASNITSQSKIDNTEKISLGVSGAGDIDMDIKAPEVSVDVSGAGSVKLKGETKNFDLDLTGTGKAHCYDLLAENTKVSISGVGDADVYASVKLDAEVSGAGKITYKGGATNIGQQISGAGSVKKVD